MARRVAFTVIVAATLACGLSAIVPAARAQPQTPSAIPEFSRDIQPLLAANCLVCHGSDESTRMSDLRLDTPAGPLSAVVPGDAASSTLYQRLTARDGLERMPPVGSGLALTEGEIESIRAWIDAGAKLGTGVALVPVMLASDRVMDFDRDVRPILSENCFLCHGPDDSVRQRGLRLDVEEGLFGDRGRFGGPVIVPGASAESALYQRIAEESEHRRMPKAGSGLSLTPNDIETIRVWIDQGAEWEPAWAFVAPVRPEIPAVTDGDWGRNPIDAFVRARLEREGLEPSEVADRSTLIRRASYDLTGLPPTLAEVESYLADDSPDAYEKVVDRLLSSPRYGERMTMRWMDLARYADTHGYHIDSHRDMWPWRDWVIEAYNANMPFDRFTIEQLAGDLLPDPTRAQRIATGFNRNHMINYEGGAIPEEYLVEYVVDRLDTTSTVWMGLTMGCSRCHDHKYDPISQRDFYRFFAFFNNVDEVGLDGMRGNADPFVRVPTLDEGRALAALRGRIVALEAELPEATIAELQEAWEATAQATVPMAPRDDLVAHFELDGDLADASGHYPPALASSTYLAYDDGRIGEAAAFDGETYVELGDGSALDLDAEQAFSIAAWVRPGTRRARYSVVSKIDEQRGYRGYAVSFGPSIVLPRTTIGAHLYFRLIHDWPSSVLSVRTREPLYMGQWQHVTIVYDGSGDAASVLLYVDGEPVEVEIEHDQLNGTIRSAAALRIGGDLHVGSPRPEKGYTGHIDDLRFYARPIDADEIDRLVADLPVRSILDELHAEPSEEPPDGNEEETGLNEVQAEELRDYFLKRYAPPQYRRAHRELQALRSELAALEDTVVTTMVMAEREEPRQTFILRRGDYRDPMDPVSPGTPSALPPMAVGAEPNRLGLARWLVDPVHPLTARVAVNRYWEMHFGTGLVKTLEDFGTRSELPSHPELLDWLATEFVRSGWDVKAMQRLIVTSSTYRQSSRLTPWHAEHDPENRLLSRASRFRLPAEMIRDGALAVSGLLNGAIGGPSVFPYQPADLWKPLAYGAHFTAQSYTPSHGEDLYRRSMYSFWKRTVPPPSLNTFDAPDRESCTVRRPRTNTPLQALVLLNDPTFVEAARFLAQRMIVEAVANPADRVRFAYRLTAARQPSTTELGVLVEVARGQLDEYRDDPEAASQLLTVGEGGYDPGHDPIELAAWANVAGIIMNLDETITRE